MSDASLETRAYLAALAVWRRHAPEPLASELAAVRVGHYAARPFAVDAAAELVELVERAGARHELDALATPSRVARPPPRQPYERPQQTKVSGAPMPGRRAL